LWLWTPWFQLQNFASSSSSSSSSSWWFRSSLWVLFFLLSSFEARAAAWSHGFHVGVTMTVEITSLVGGWCLWAAHRSAIWSWIQELLEAAWVVEQNTHTRKHPKGIKDKNKQTEVAN
jgi:hypothetical protein